MTEQEYINAGDLAKIRSALAVLSLIVPDCSTIFSKEEFYKATAILYGIQDRMAKAVRITPLTPLSEDEQFVYDNQDILSLKEMAEHIKVSKSGNFCAVSKMINKANRFYGRTDKKKRIA